jgi:hypothetical protein
MNGGIQSLTTCGSMAVSCITGEEDSAFLKCIGHTDIGYLDELRLRE